MGCRAIRLAALSAIFALTAWATVSAQNLEAGKTPQQMFAGTCAACHSTPRGLLKSVGPGQLPGFLRQHYTTGSDMAGALAGYLMQNGATQRVETPVKGGKGAKKSADEETAPAAKSRRQAEKQPPAETAEEGNPTAGKKKLSSKKKGKREEPAAAPAAAKQPSPVLAPEPPVAAPEPKPAEAAAPAPAEVKVDADGIPLPPEPPPLSPDLSTPAGPSTPLPPPQPPM